jgi:hypothetical protein
MYRTMEVSHPEKFHGSDPVPSGSATLHTESHNMVQGNKPEEH